MQGKARFVFPAVIAFFMSFMMSGVITAINLGLPSDFLWQWAKAWAIAYPLAAMAAFVSAGPARAITAFIVARLEPR
jgi:branched-subunit amino acid transport protein